MSRTIPRDPDLSRAARTVLEYVGAWYNGLRITTRDGKARMAYDHPPSFHDLVASANIQEAALDQGLETLRKRGYLKTESICRSTIDWVPTDRGRKYILQEFEYDTLWRDEPVSLLGDWNEGLYHRTGVETTLCKGLELPFVDWAVAYPGERGQQRGDGVLKTEHGTWRVEVISFHHDRPDYYRKYEVYAQDDIPTLWVFDSSALCFRILNWIQHDSNVDEPARLVNGTFDDPENWRIQKGNEYLYRSHNEPGEVYRCPGIDMVQTVTRLLEADQDEIAGWFKEYFKKH